MTNRPHILITAGPTREMLDPVRFLSNLSTGEMGYQVAREAKRKGCQVTLISGPTALKRPKGIHFVPVVTAGEMERAVKFHFRKCDALIMTAAVCDYRPDHKSAQKIKRIRQRSFTLKRTNDILKAVTSRKGNRLVVGFCLETENLERNAVRKLREKKMDLIVANSYTKSQNPFGRHQVSVLMIDHHLKKRWLSRSSKRKLAKYLLHWVTQGLRKRRFGTKKVAIINNNK